MGPRQRVVVDSVGASPVSPLRWAGGDRARWRGRDVVVEYAADDGALISWEVPPDEPHAFSEYLAATLGRRRMRFAIVALTDLELRLPN